MSKTSNTIKQGPVEIDYESSTLIVNFDVVVVININFYNL